MAAIGAHVPQCEHHHGQHQHRGGPGFWDRWLKVDLTTKRTIHHEDAQTIHG